MIARRIANISALNFFDYGIRFAAVLVVTPFLLKTIGKETYGLWLFLVSLLGYLNIVELSLSNTAVRFFGRAIQSKAKRNSAAYFLHFRTLYRRAAAFAVLLSILVALLSPLFSTDPAVVQASMVVFLLGGGILGATFFFRVRVALMKAHLCYRQVITASLVRFLLNTAGILLVLPRYPNITTLAILWTVAAVVEQAILWWMGRPLIPEVRHANPLPSEERNEIFRFSQKCLANIASNYFRNRADTVVLGTMVSVTSVAHYGIGSRFLVLFQDLATAVFGGHLLSVFSRMKPGPNGLLSPDPLYRTLRFSVPFACIGGTALFLIGPAFIDLWLGPGFEEAHIVLRWLALPYALTLMQLPVNPWIGAQNRHGWFAISKLAGGILNLVGSILLVLAIGFPGVVIATAIEMTIIALIAWPWILHRQCAVPFQRFLKALALPTAQLLPSIIGAVVLCNVWPCQTWGNFILQGGAILIAFAANTWILVLENGERDLILRFLFRQPG